MTKHLEVERRWLIRLPLSAEAKKAIEDDSDVPAHIVQTYLKSDDDAVHRVRFVEYDFWDVSLPAHYTHTTKKFVEYGVNEEDESSLTETEWQTKLLDRDPETITIEKTRHHLHYKGKLLELDLFDREWDGLAILECEVPSLDTEVELPSYLTIDREITKESGWSNFDLAHRYSEPQDAWFGQTGIDEVWLEQAHIEAKSKTGSKVNWWESSFSRPKSGWFARLMSWFRPETPSYDGRNERVYGEQIDEEID